MAQGALAVLWLVGRDGDVSRLPILTLDEARAGGALIVTERGRATVPELIADLRAVGFASGGAGGRGLA